MADFDYSNEGSGSDDSKGIISAATTISNYVYAMIIIVIVLETNDGPF